MNRMNFYKISGSGNDFIVIDNMDGSISNDPADLAAKLCRRKFSIGADGLIMLEKSDIADFRWRFHNADGSEAEMCGNGGRCAARFAVLRNITDETLSFETEAGIINARVTGKRVKIKLTDPVDLKRNIEVPVDERNRVVSFINTGVPHVVKVVPDIENFDVVGIGRKLRYHNLFQPEGTNANFIEIKDGNTISLRTYERGVEDETLACGTGAVASAIIASLDGSVKSPVTVVTRGGETLIIYFTPEHGEFRDVYLEGDTAVVCSGEVLEEAY